MSNVIEFIGYEFKDAERLASRKHLGFYINNFGTLTTLDGYRSEDRPASDAEQEMWNALFGDVKGTSDGYLPATTEEIITSLQFREGPITISQADSVTLIGMKGFHTLKSGCFGCLRNSGSSDVYVSDYIQPGYFYLGPVIKEILWDPHWKPEDELKELSVEIVAQVQENYYPFIA